LSAPPIASVPEAFAWQGAGLTLFKVWCFLEGIHESELAAHLNARCRYLRGQLDRLADLGLAVCDTEGRWTRVVFETALDAAAVRLDVAGRRARQRQRHIREQEGFAAWLREQAGQAQSASAIYFERAADDADRFLERARSRSILPAPDAAPCSFPTGAFPAPVLELEPAIIDVPDFDDPDFDVPETEQRANTASREIPVPV